MIGCTGHGNKGPGSGENSVATRIGQCDFGILASFVQDVKKEDSMASGQRLWIGGDSCEGDVAPAGPIPPPIIVSPEMPLYILGVCIQMR